MTEKEAGLVGKMVAGFGRPLATAAKKQTSGRVSKLLSAVVKRMSTGRVGRVMRRTSPVVGEGGQPTVTERKPLRWAKALAQRAQQSSAKRVTQREARRAGYGALGLGGYGGYRLGRGGEQEATEETSEKAAQRRTELAFAAELGATLARRN